MADSSTSLHLSPDLLPELPLSRSCCLNVGSGCSVKTDDCWHRKQIPQQMQWKFYFCFINSNPCGIKQTEIPKEKIVAIIIFVWRVFGKKLRPEVLNFLTNHLFPPHMCPCRQFFGVNEKNYFSQNEVVCGLHRIVCLRCLFFVASRCWRKGQGTQSDAQGERFCLISDNRQFKHQTLFATQTQTQRNLIVKPNQKGRICYTPMSHWLRNLGYIGFEFTLQLTFHAWTVQYRCLRQLFW